MYLLNVSLNGSPLCFAGIAEASSVSVVVGASVYGDEVASFHVAGMQELDGERMAHVYWVEEHPLNIGDVLSFVPSEGSRPSVPALVKPTDSPEYLKEQKQYDEFRASHIYPQPTPVQKRSTIAYGLWAPGFPVVEARLSLRQQHLLCSVLWNKWRPERTRVSVRSFASGDVESSKVAWLQTNLSQGEEFKIEVRA